MGPRVKAVYESFLKRRKSLTQRRVSISYFPPPEEALRLTQARRGSRRVDLEVLEASETHLFISWHGATRRGKVIFRLEGLAVVRLDQVIPLFEQTLSDTYNWSIDPPLSEVPSSGRRMAADLRSNREGREQLALKT